MSFLTPLFLLGALAIAAPVIFHLIRRTTKDKVSFSSLMFLQPTPPRLTRRSRLEHIFLLLLRCLVFVLLAIGFARPFLPKSLSADSEKDSARHIVVLIDTSASMRREGVWSAALDEASKAVRDSKGLDQVAVFAFDKDVHRLVTFEQWNSTVAAERIALALKQVSDLKPSWQSTHLDRALLAAVDALEETGARDTRKEASGPREIVLITDLQEGGHTEGLQAFEWPAGVSLRVEAIKARRPTNAGLQLVADSSPADADEVGLARVRISNSTDASREQFVIGWATKDGSDFNGESLDVYVPPGQSRVFPLPKTPAGLPEEKLRLAGDEETFDNAAFLVAQSAEDVRVLFVGDDNPADVDGSLFYFQRAFPQSKSQKVVVQNFRGDAAIPADALSKAALIVITGKPSDSQTTALRDAIQRGRTALFAMPDRESVSVLARLSGVGPVRCEEAVVANYSLIARVNFEHPLFKPFADPRYSDFAKIVFWKHRKLDTMDFPNASVLAAFDDGSPALLQVPSGKGTLLVLTSGWHPKDSQFALSTKFVPLMHSLLRFGGWSAAESQRLLIGDTLRFRGNEQTRATITKPDGTTVQAAPGNAFADTDQPGIYVVRGEGEPQRFAVNLDPNESRTAPLPLEELGRLGVPMKSAEPAARTTLAAKQQLLNAELEGKQKLWRWLVVAALIVLLVETWLAGRLTKQSPA